MTIQRQITSHLLRMLFGRGVGVLVVSLREEEIVFLDEDADQVCDTIQAIDHHLRVFRLGSD